VRPNGTVSRDQYASMYWYVDVSASRILDLSMSEAVWRTVSETVDRAACWPVYLAVDRAVRGAVYHDPALADFLHSGKGAA
jgi:hypothetical protein